MRKQYCFLAAYAAVNLIDGLTDQQQDFLAAYAAVNVVHQEYAMTGVFLAAYAAVNCRNCILIRSKSISWVVFFVFTNEIIRFRK